jgi:DNA-binding transcriptional MerR regulator
LYAPHDETFALPELMPIENRPHQIGELAEKFGITLRTIRFYEQKGLIEPRRVGARTRIYGIDEVARLGLIVTLRRFRFTVDEIADLLALRDTLGADAFPPRLVEALAKRRAELDDEIAELQIVRAELDGLVGGLERQG